MNPKDVSKRVEEILNRMTPEEKIAQMMQVSYAHCTREEALEWAKKGVGSFLHVLGDDAREVQRTALNTRLGIPVLFGIDAVHGHCLNRKAAIFPSQLGMACTFDRQLVHNIGHATAQEVAADGLHWTFSPILCLGRDLRWGRVDETFGEDPFLSGELGKAIVEGYQGDDLSAEDSILACAKHYIGYGEAVGGRDSCDTEMTFRKLKDVFLPPFAKAVEAGCGSFMTAYGSIDGTPFTVSRKALKEILRDELGFDGFVVTDWDNMNSLVNYQHICENTEDAAAATAEAGNDMIMRSLEFYEAACAAYRKGSLKEETINEAVRHILTVKVRMGLFEHPEKKCDTSLIGCEAHRSLALQSARESVVLLKNENNVLPICNAKRIAVIGPNADNIKAQYGDWTYLTHPENNVDTAGPERPYTTGLEGIRASFPDAEIVYREGCALRDSDGDDISSAVNAARDCDCIVLVLGDDVHQTGEGKDRADLSLSGKQTQLAHAMKQLEKPLILVMLQSKPLAIPEESALADAVVFAFNNGMYGGQAVAEVLSGAINPCGRLPISVARHSGQLPVYYNALPGWHGGKYEDLPAEPLYAFGEGLGYTSFRYENLAFDSETMTATVDVTNAGEREGTETVQVYFHDEVCSVLTPVRSLIAFERVTLQAGETKCVSFRLAREDFSFVNISEERVVEPGSFKLMVGHSSKPQDLLECRFELK